MPRWPVVRLIAARELRDQLRDRRTLFLVLGLPVLMYPLFVGVGLLYAAAVKDKKLVVAVAGAEHLPGPRPDLTAVAGGAAGHAAAAREFPPLLAGDGFPPAYLAGAAGNGTLVVRSVPGAGEDTLARRDADAVLVVPPDFAAKLARGERAAVRVLGRDGEENSKLAVARLTGVLRAWAEKVKEARFARAGLPADFDLPIDVRDPQSEKPADKRAFDEIRDLLVKMIPFLLLMWMLTGSIYPAVDVTAGEKERGTMETLLISPAGRAEIVWGKFLAVTGMGFGTAVWNVLLMVAAVAVVQAIPPHPEVVSLPGLAACVLAALPLAALVAAGTLALGVFARSTKEGNYYMVPVFLLVLPLAYWSMSPGKELDGVTSWVPVANALLLQQRLLAVRPDPFPWAHLPAVAASLGLCIALAVWAAVRQFKRESVLFRQSA
jgi:sodium transport system permease protein